MEVEPYTLPTELMKEYYVQRADAGLIVTEGILIVRQGCVALRRLSS